MNGLAVCSGIGGFDLGLKLACEGYRTVCHIEREAYAAAVLAKRMEEGRLDKAPIWDDLATFDARSWRGVVDIVTSGLPCQPYSVAGRREGDKDERYIWPDFFRVVDEVQPTLVFLENVPGITAWFRPIGEELSGMGYEFEAGLFSAEEIGATHRRERFFCLAYRRCEHIKLQQWAQRLHESQAEGGELALARRCNEARGLPESREEEGPQGESGGCGHVLGHSPQPGLQGWGLSEYSEKSAGWQFPFPPSPDDAEAWGRILQDYPHLAPAGQTQPFVRGVANEFPYRVDRLRALGNAVVPLTVAKAFVTLMGKAEV